MKVWSLPTLQSVQRWEDLRNFASQALNNFSQIFSNNVSFGDNVFCQIVTGVSITSTSDTKISHTLGVVPIGIIVLKQTDFGVLKQTSQAWTTTEIYLNASIDGDYTIAIIGG